MLSGSSPSSAWAGGMANPVSQHFRDLLAEFNAHHVEYIVVGAHAVAAHGHVRATKDLDLWVRPTNDNARRVLKAIMSFGAPLHDLTEDDLAQPGMVFQIGVPPLRIDVITAIDGVEFAEAWRERVETEFAGEPVFVLSLHHLSSTRKRLAGCRISLTLNNSNGSRACVSRNNRQDYVYYLTFPGPQSARPGFASVCSPSFSTCTPLTKTCFTPTEY